MKFISSVVVFALLLSCAAAQIKLVLLDPSTNAVCLDGSPAAYYFRPGSGADKDKYILFMEGGGLCTSLSDCYARSLTTLGSSTQYPSTVSSLGGGILDTNPQNPLANWNVAYMKYCNGGRWTGNADPVKYNSTINLHFRGTIAVEQTVKDLTARFGMDQATTVVLGGCSAGGEGVYYNLDFVRSLIPTTVTVVGMADAGWFLDINSVLTNQPSPYTAALPGAYALWNASHTLNYKCIEANGANAWKCLFASYLYDYMTTPFFIMQSDIDSLQIAVLYQLPCASDLTKCNASEEQQLNNYVNAYRSDISHALANPSTGIFLDMCLAHCQSQDNGWFTKQIKGVSPSQAFSNFLFNHALTKYQDDCDYGCDKTC